MSRDKRTRPEQMEYRSATGNAALGLSAAGLVAPFVAPKFHEVIGKMTTPKEGGPKVELPSGQIRPKKD